MVRATVSSAPPPSVPYLDQVDITVELARLTAFACWVVIKGHQPGIFYDWYVTFVHFLLPTDLWVD